MAQHNPHVELEDLEQDGVFGLADALWKFDPGRGLKFQTYASHRIWGAMLDGIRERDWVPRLARARQKKGAAVIGMVPIETPVAGEKTIADLVAAGEYQARPEPIDQNLLAGLPAAHQLLVRLYFEMGMTLKECGQAVGLTESRMSQMLTEAKEMIRDRVPEEN